MSWLDFTVLSLKQDEKHVEGGTTMKKILMCCCIPLMLAVHAQVAFGWANATHTYLAKSLGAHHGFQNLNEMYGAVLPDAFNLVPGVGTYLDGQAHTNYMAMVKRGWRCDLKALAFGFTSHNDLWGADFTAHHEGRTTSGPGWVVLKSTVLAPDVQTEVEKILNDAGVPSVYVSAIAPAAALELSHNLVEIAVDVLVKRNLDPEIGSRMWLAAKLRPLDTPLLLAAAYACGLSQAAHISVLDATKLIIGVEKEYREYCVQYGKAFSLPPPQDVLALSVQGAAFAKEALEKVQVLFGITSPYPVTVDPQVVAGFIEAAINVSIQYPDYNDELQATLSYLEGTMHNHHIPTCSGWFAKGEAGEQPEAETIEAPVEFSLGDNYPNPFNPATTIDYSVPRDARVLLKVYNSLGQEVATLVDVEMAAGKYQVTWDASGVASGVYFYRLTAGSNSAMKRMLLLK